MAIKTDPHFSTEKARVLSKVDLSRKGSVDEPIAELVSYINALEDFYTTSSCSGRLAVLQEESEQKKKGCHWWLMSHDPISHHELESSLGKAVGSGLKSFAYFKFEPFVLHVICRTLEDAQNMMQVAVSSGFRNSGISCGKKRKIMVAVRSTQCLETPVVSNGNFLVSSEYLQTLVELGNIKMQDNFQRIERFFLQMKEMVKEKCRKDSPDLGDLGTDRSKSDGRQCRTHDDEHVQATVKKNENDCGSGHKKESTELELDEVDIGCLFT